MCLFTKLCAEIIEEKDTGKKKILMVITDVNNLSVFLEIPCDCCSFLWYKMEDKSWRQHSQEKEIEKLRVSE